MKIFLAIILWLPTMWIDWESGMRAYSQGRAFHGPNGFQFHEEKDGPLGKRVIAWWPVKTKYGWIWFDYYWKLQ